MLKARIGTALVLLPLIVGILVWGSTLSAALLMGLITVLTSYELARLLSPVLMSENAKDLLTYGLAMGSGVGVYVLGVLDAPLGFFWLLWTFLMALSCLAPGVIGQRIGRMLISCFAGLYCGGSWLAMWHLYTMYPYAGGLIMMMTVVIVADSAAYFGGTRWGCRKLAPNLSPGKSWEGFWCGISASMVGALLCNSFYGEIFGSPLLVALMGAFGAAAGVVGDLIESALKRCAGVKDSGHLLPGHGGFLDRCDAAMFAAPVFVVFLRNFS